jgi:hypothetical protein
MARWMGAGCERGQRGATATATVVAGQTHHDAPPAVASPASCVGEEKATADTDTDTKTRRNPLCRTIRPRSQHARCATREKGGQPTPSCSPHIHIPPGWPGRRRWHGTHVAHPPRSLRLTTTDVLYYRYQYSSRYSTVQYSYLCVLGCHTNIAYCAHTNTNTNSTLHSMPAAPSNPTAPSTQFNAARVVARASDCDQAQA